MTDDIIGHVTWPDDQIRRLQEFLMTLRHQRRKLIIEKLSTKMDDPDSSRWISLEDAEKRLGSTGE